MQNRNMFLYRRQGPKKRPKSGASRKGRNPQKGLPTSARDLLPIIQPATKALAQMLAGRTAASGQLGHARAVLAQTDRLIADRAHNQLNPAEREEFFEQIARLKLTLSDAEDEAEAQAAEEQAPAPPPVPVDRERLKAMALSLTMSSDKTKNASDETASENSGDGPPPTDDDGESEAEEAPTVRSAKADLKRSDDPNQLRLPRETSEKLSLQPGPVGADGTIRRRKPKLATAPKSGVSSPRAAAKKPAEKGEANGGGDKPEASGQPAVAQKLPKGWVIDDEGFVVPGPG